MTGRYADGTSLRALSLTRPWTWLVLHGGKNIENRVWQTSYRGTLLIHGAKSRDPRAVVPFLDLLDADQRRAWSDALTLDPGRPADVPAYWTGLLGTVEVTGCCTAAMDTDTYACECGPWAMPGQAHWQLSDPRPFVRPITCNGALGLWTPSPALVAQLAERGGAAR